MQVRDSCGAPAWTNTGEDNHPITNNHTALVQHKTGACELAGGEVKEQQHANKQQAKDPK